MNTRESAAPTPDSQGTGEPQQQPRVRLSALLTTVWCRGIKKPRALTGLKSSGLIRSERDVPVSGQSHPSPYKGSEHVYHMICLVKFFLICHTILIISHCLEHLLELVNSVVSKFCFSEKVLVDTLYASVYLWEQSVLKYHRWVQCIAITQSN